MFSVLNPFLENKRSQLAGWHRDGRTQVRADTEFSKHDASGIAHDLFLRHEIVDANEARWLHGAHLLSAVAELPCIALDEFIEQRAQVFQCCTARWTILAKKENLRAGRGR